MSLPAYALSPDPASQAGSFDSVSSEYERYRPGYPPELIDAIVARCGLKPGARLLEVGCGTGRATLLMAQRGYRVHALDPGINLIMQASRATKGATGVSFQLTRFEDWQGRRRFYDLVFSAQAFHWVDQAQGYAQAARALRAGGWLALFWNLSPQPAGSLCAELDAAYARCAPDMKPAPDFRSLIAGRTAGIRACGLFGEPVVLEFPWVQRYSTADYLGLLGTYSDHILLPEDPRQALFGAIAEILDAHGGYIDRPYHAVLYLAQKPA